MLYSTTKSNFKHGSGLHPIGLHIMEVLLNLELDIIAMEALIMKVEVVAPSQVSRLILILVISLKGVINICTMVIVIILSIPVVFVTDYMAIQQTSSTIPRINLIRIQLPHQEEEVMHTMLLENMIL